MKDKILITGINGFLGSHLAKYLKSKYEVIGLEYSVNDLHRIKNEDFVVYESKEELLEEIFQKNNFLAVVHVATIYRRQNEPILNLLKTNINLPVRLFELANSNNVRLFINTDSFFNNSKFAYSYLSDYTLSKKQSLEWIKMLAAGSKSCKVVNMKIYHMFGENDAPNKFIPFIIDKLKNNEDSLELTPGEQTRDFIYVKDVVSAYGHVLDNFEKIEKYQEFHVGSGKVHTIKELVKTVKEITEANTELLFGSLDYRQGEIMESHITNETLFDLGWKPKFNLYEALKCIIEQINQKNT